MRPDPRIDKARDVPLQTVLAKHCNLKFVRRGQELKGPCPACGGDERFCVSLKKQQFVCHSCEASGGGAIDLVKFIKGVDFQEAVTLLNGEAPPKKKPNGNGAAHSEPQWLD
jgi:phage/plasmid primase-like uncharacterized protein